MILGKNNKLLTLKYLYKMKLQDKIKGLIDQTEAEYDLIGKTLDDLTKKLEKAVTDEDEFKAILKTMEVYKRIAEDNRDRLRGLYKDLENAKLFNLEV